MYKVVPVIIEETKNIYYLSPDDLNLKVNDYVIFNDVNGLQYGRVIKNIYEEKEDNLNLPLNKVIRVMTEDDFNQIQENKKIAVHALVDAKKISKKLNLDMNFVDSYFTFDKNQLIFSFLSDNRVDFRELAKKLAQKYKTRIELRQIGVRDKAKEIGGLGPCGRFLCCNTFLNDFNSVSINMAKNQYLSLSPSKINGICGRLLCCLKYEDDTYTEMKKNFPPIGTRIKNKNFEGKVISHNLLKNTFTIEKADKTQEEVENNYENNK